MSLPRISIIVPVYNAESSIADCIDSIINQSFDDWELLLINDGSSDNSGEICEEYSKKDSRIRTIHKENGGVSSARNEGLKFANGDYISFIDADDEIECEFLKSLNEQTSTDLIIGGFTSDNGFSFRPEACCSCDLSGNTDLIKNLISTPYYLDSPWGKLFNRQIIQENDLRFDPSLRLSEDTLFCYRYLATCKSITIVNESLYHYSGIWGGDAKYVLTLDEVKDVRSKIVNSLYNIQRAFNVKLSTEYKGFHLSKVKCLFSKYSDIEVYKAYTAPDNNIDIESFLGDNQISPLTIGLKEAMSIVRTGNIRKTENFLAELRTFITTPIGKIKFKSAKQKIFYNVLNIMGPRAVMALLKLYIKL